MSIDYNEMDLLVPNFPLILYAKNWIRFKRKLPDITGSDYLLDDMSKIVEMCGYVPVKNPTLQVVMLFDGIVRYLQEMNEISYPLKSSTDLDSGLASVTVGCELRYR